MPPQDPCQVLHSLQIDDVIEVHHRGEAYTLQVVEAGVGTEKPEIYANQYHVLVRGQNAKYRLFSTGKYHGSAVTIENNVSNSTHPLWKSIGTVDRIDVLENDDR